MTRSHRPLFSDATGERDAVWVRAALAGDTEAFGQLVEAYQQQAVSTAYRLIGNTHDAMEVAQEAFLRAFRSLGRLKKPTRFGPWMMRIVSNLSLNARRSRRSGSTVTLDEQRGTERTTRRQGEPVTTSVSPDRQALDRELQAAIDAALDSLPDKQRLALVLFTIEGWSQKDIAAMLECSLETVKWNVFQARKRLREELGDVMTG